MKKSLIFLAFCTTLIISMSGCTVIKIADAAASTAIGVTKGAVKVTGAAVGAVIPDGDKKDEEKEDK